MSKIKERITCKSHCIYWNSIDKDCELYGENHPRPRQCLSYWKSIIKVGKIYKHENGEIFVVSNVFDNFYSVIYLNGYSATYGMTEENLNFVFGTFVAEYPTWQEAVNSSEFKGKK